jgi:sugar phosphate isomerase/epimerase
MKFSFATLGCPAWSLERIASEARLMGYDGVELRTHADGNHVPVDASAEACQKIRELFQRESVAIPCLMGYTNFAVPDDAAREASEQTCRSLIRTAANLKCPTVRFFGGSSKEDQAADVLRRVATSLKKVLPLAEQNGVTLAFETHDAWCEPSELIRLMDELTSPRLGVCWDIANTSQRIAHERIWRALKPRIVHVHAKDIGETHKAIALPGEGTVRLSEALAMIAADGYEHWVSFEWEKKWNPGIADPEVALPHFIEFARRVVPVRPA